MLFWIRIQNLAVSNLKKNIGIILFLLYWAGIRELKHVQKSKLKGTEVYSGGPLFQMFQSLIDQHKSEKKAQQDVSWGLYIYLSLFSIRPDWAKFGLEEIVRRMILILLSYCRSYNREREFFLLSTYDPSTITVCPNGNFWQSCIHKTRILV